MSRILIVDDDPEIRENLTELLGGSGFDVSVAASGEEALERLAASPFDVVLLDLIMPGMGGMEALSAIRRGHPRVKVVMLTAFATVDNAVAAVRKGAEDYLAKPFRVEELLTTVRRILEEARFRDRPFLIDVDSTFSSLANVIRRDILRLISRERRIRFMDIARRLSIDDHTKMNFHLKTLRDAGLLRQDERKCYLLTAEGERVVGFLDLLGEKPTA